MRCFHFIIMNSRNPKFCLRNRSVLGAQKGTPDKTIWLMKKKKIVVLSLKPQHEISKVGS